MKRRLHHSRSMPVHSYLMSRSWRPAHALTGALCLVLLACSGGKDDLAGPNPDPDPDPDPDPVVSSRITGVITVSGANPSGAVLAAVGSPRPTNTPRAQAD